jgi:hypothetical protein
MTKARDLADLGNKTSLDEINDAYDAGALSNRNFIINGAMAISQRNGTSVISPAPSGYGSADRFATYKSGAGTFSIQQSTDSPSGFINSIKATVTSASTPSGTNYYHIQHTIEGQNFASLAQGTSDAKTFTLSFYVKSSITGTFSGSFRDSTPSISYVFEYTVNSANTWERKTITVDGASSGTFLTNNGAGAYLAFSLGQGTTYGSSTVGSWHSGNYHGSSSETKFIANAGATLQITGVQVEVGDTATPFEHRSYGDELAKCQRYLWRGKFCGAGCWGGGGTIPLIGHNFPVAMRTAPTTSRISGGVASNGAMDALITGLYGVVSNSNLSQRTLFNTALNSATNSQGCDVQDVLMSFDAEL